MTFNTISLRNFAYAALLAAATLTLAPSLASAQEPVHGKFTLTHDVSLGNAKLPAGDYAFSFDRNAVSPVMSLSKLSGTRAGFLVLVPVTENTKPTDANRLLLKSNAEGTYVSAMQLPEFGLTLRFDVPRIPERQIARASMGAAGSGQ